MKNLIAISTALIVLSSCASTTTESADKSASSVSAAPEWTQTSFFTPSATDRRPTEPFRGRLSFETTKLEIDVTPADKFVQNPWAWWGLFDFLKEQDPAGAAKIFDLDAQLFPGLDIEFFTSSDNRLVPVQRDIIRKPIVDRTNSFWEIIASPGRVWAASQVDGEYASWNKAAFPFSLVQSQEGEAWIGLASFYYKDGKVSNTKVQLSSDSAGGFIFWDPDFDVNAWGEIPTVQTSTTIENESSLQNAYVVERANRLPTKPLADLGSQAVVDAVAALDPISTLSAAIMYNGTLYMDPVKTPFGVYPYPQDMRVGVWSATKSLVPGLAALRLAEKYGADFLDTKIVDYFKAGEEFDYVDAASEARWKQVTLRNALQMSTGMGATDYNTNWASDNLNTYKWGYSYKIEDMIRYYFNVTPNPEVTGPGQKFAYIDQDMWIASMVMDRFIKQKQGPDASLIKFLRTEVYKPIGVDHFALGTNYTDSGELGYTYGGWGALPTIDILAKAGRLVASGGITPNGRQILSKELLSTYPSSGDYQLAFWKQNLTIDGIEIHVPYMSGAGGNKIYALPNGMSVVVLGRDNYNGGPTDEQTAELVTAALKVTKP